MSDQAIDNLTQALEGEYAATYAYGLIGARVSGGALTRARQALSSHRQARDELRLVRNWAAVATTSAGPSRDRAVRHAQECATRAVTWGSPSQAFPG